MRVETRDANGVPMCPICGTEVSQAGMFCGETCHGHFLQVVTDQSGTVEMEDYVFDNPPYDVG